MAKPISAVGQKKTAKKVITQEMLDQVRDGSSRGLDKLRCSYLIDVAYSTFKKWCKEHEAFADAYKKGRQQARGTVEDALFRNAVEKNNVVAQIFYLKNRHSGLWKDRQTHEQKIDAKIDGENKLPQAIIVVPEHCKNVDEWLKKINESTTPANSLEGSARTADVPTDVPDK